MYMCSLATISHPRITHYPSPAHSPLGFSYPVYSHSASDRPSLELVADPPRVLRGACHIKPGTIHAKKRRVQQKRSDTRPMQSVVRSLRGR